MLERHSSERLLVDERTCRIVWKGKAIPSSSIFLKSGADPPKIALWCGGGGPVASLSVIRGRFRINDPGGGVRQRCYYVVTLISEFFLRCTTKGKVGQEPIIRSIDAPDVQIIRRSCRHLRKT